MWKLRNFLLYSDIVFFILDFTVLGLIFTFSNDTKIAYERDPNEKISYQLGDANLLFQLSQRKIISNFRKNDLLNGGEGAPLTPLFHQLIASQNKFNLPLCILNIGGKLQTVYNFAKKTKPNVRKISGKKIFPLNPSINISKLKNYFKFIW